jgi:hypothetical protein
MGKTAIEVADFDNLKVEVFAGEDVLLLFQGVMREEDPEKWLSPFLKRVADLSWNRKRIVVDLVRLSFMNATAFRVFLPWLKELGDRKVPCKVVIRIKEGIIWQAVAVSALKAIAGSMIVSETVISDAP